MFGDLIEGFTLGNAAILTNVCLLPLYPGLIAFLAGNVDDERPRYVTVLLGGVVLAGVLSMMIIVGLVLHLLNIQQGDALFIILPVVYALVILMGLLMLSGRNPFARFTMMQAPQMRSPFLTAYTYGLLLGPMTLPCTGPILITAFAVGLDGGGSLGVEMAYVIAYGLGFGWPLVVLPFFAVEAQRRFTRALTTRHLLLTRLSGVLLIIIGLIGVYTEIIDNPSFMI